MATVKCYYIINNNFVSLNVTAFARWKKACVQFAEQFTDNLSALPSLFGQSGLKVSVWITDKKKNMLYFMNVNIQCQ